MDSVWSAIAALSSLLSAAVVMVALFYADKQIREAKTQRNIGALRDFHSFYNTYENRLLRDQILRGDFGSPDEFDAHALPEPDRTRYFIMVDELEFIAAQVEFGYLDFDLFVGTFRLTPPKMWLYEKRRVLEGRRKEGSPEAKQYTERLADRYDKHFQRKHGLRHPAFR